MNFKEIMANKAKLDAESAPMRSKVKERALKEAQERAKASAAKWKQHEEHQEARKQELAEKERLAKEEAERLQMEFDKEQERLREERIKAEQAAYELAEKRKEEQRLEDAEAQLRREAFDDKYKELFDVWLTWHHKIHNKDGRGGVMDSFEKGKHFNSQPFRPQPNHWDGLTRSIKPQFTSLHITDSCLLTIQQ